jgi:hypothetical protein
MAQRPELPCCPWPRYLRRNIYSAGPAEDDKPLVPLLDTSKHHRESSSRPSGWWGGWHDERGPRVRPPRSLLLLWLVSGQIVLVAVTPARAVPRIQEYRFPVPASGPRGSAAGPDGNVWFTETSGNRIGRITTEGVLTEYRVHRPNSLSIEIAAGPDGRMWFTELAGNKIGAVRPSTASPAVESTPRSPPLTVEPIPAALNDDFAVPLSLPVTNADSFFRPTPRDTATW